MERMRVFNCECCSRSVYLEEVEHDQLAFESDTCPECLNGEEFEEIEKDMFFFI